jgi:hypothetical protein
MYSQVSVAYFKADQLCRHLTERIYRNYRNAGRYFRWELKIQNSLPIPLFLSLFYTHAHASEMTP